MIILKNTLTMATLNEMAEGSFGDMVKGVVDVERELLALDAELHSDLESLLLDDGSAQEHLWGINLYPELAGDDFLEFDSMINMRPSRGNMTRGVDDEPTRRRIVEVAEKWMEK